MSVNLTDKTLESLNASGEDVLITLRDGSSHTGRVLDFDGYTLMLSGTPDFMVYRHSILKLVPASAAVVMSSPAKPQRPSAERSATTGAPRRPQPMKPRKPAHPKRQEIVQPKTASGDSGFANPMADEMMKWLKSQKGGG